MKTYTYNLSTIASLAPTLWSYVNDYKLVLLQGEMGAGKTTLLSALCKAKKVSCVVNSPTYNLLHEYTYEENDGTKHLIYHFDLYRLRSEEEVLDIGFLELIQSGSLCFVEWGERASRLLEGFSGLVFELSFTSKLDQRVLVVRTF